MGNTNKLKKLQVKELFEDKGNKMEEKETLAPQEEKEESKVEDECTYLEDIEEEKEEESQNITERVSLEVIDEKAKESASSEKIALNLEELPKTKSLPRLVSTRPKRQKTQRATQSSVKE